MSKQIRKKPHSGQFKFKVALKAIQGNQTTAELCQEYGVVSSQIYKWKKALLDQGSEIFEKGSAASLDSSAEIERLHAKIGRLTIENDFLEKVLGKPV